MLYRRLLMHKKSQDTTVNILDYLTIEALADGLTASLSVNACEYCIDGDGNWMSLEANTATEAINTGHTLSFRGKLTPTSTSGIGTFLITKDCNLKGNCMSMLFGDDGKDIFSLKSEAYAFFGLFRGNTTIIDASNLLLPATEISQRCYRHMFFGCTNLTKAPQLPATCLQNYCYYYMFSDCTSLLEAPQLPATVLSNYCYQFMFRNCTKIIEAPVLEAKILTTGSYANMFQGCTSLSWIKMLAEDISPSNCLINWVSNVSLTGTFIKSASMNNLSSGASGIPSGWTVEYE